MPYICNKKYNYYARICLIRKKKGGIPDFSEIPPYKKQILQIISY